MLSVTGLNVRYDGGESGLALRDVGFSISEGERVALLGANGAGKTTLLLTLAGVLTPESGVITVGSVTSRTDTLDDIRRKLGMVFQDSDDQLFMPTVSEDVAFGPRHGGMNNEETMRMVEDMLDSLGIRDMSSRMVHRLSGGEKRLVALAGALVTGPSLLLLDEPTGSLDAGSRRRLMDVLSGLPQAMLIATHDLGFAQVICSRAITLDAGEIRADGAVPEEL